MTSSATLFTAERLAAAVDYPTYAAQLDRLVAEGRTTGPDQSEFMVHYTLMNQHRMRRIYLHTKLNESLVAAAAAIVQPQLWLVLTEAWCGDAAQNVPVLARVAETNPNIKLRLLYRDEHLPLMDAYLTNGGRSIPKLIILRENDLTKLGTWGPRPAAIQTLMTAWKANPEGRSKMQVIEDVITWYNHDKTQSMQAELEALLRQIASGTA